MKRFICALLVVLLVVCLLPATALTAFAATTKVGRINAVGAGYGYSSTLGAYAPVFSTLEAYDTAGNKINISNFVDASRYAFYTSASFTSANKLTTEPQYGETYYFGIAVDLYVDDVSYDYDHDSIINNSTVSLPGFEVEYDGLMEREMGSYLQIIYKATRVYPVYVGGVGMRNGDYLAVGATKTQTTKPSGGYAYYKNGTLTLNNYSYEGKGYQYDSVYDYSAVIYTKNDLPLILIGNNTLTQTYYYSDMIYVDGANLTVGGDGKLTGTSGGHALYADKGITINGGTIEVSTFYSCIHSYGGEVIINDGDITAESEHNAAISSKYVTVNGGNVTAIGADQAIVYSTGFTVPDSMKIQASTTVDGELGEYVAANNNSYKKITIHSHNFGTAWKYKEADGHAHVCSFCSEHDTVIKHTPDISAPTENQDQKCTVCGYVIAPSLGHIHQDNLTKVTAKPATCTSDGNSEYYTCSCGKWFTDNTATTEITVKDSVKIPAAHADSDNNGKCDACGKNLTVTPPHEHKFVEGKCECGETEPTEEDSNATEPVAGQPEQEDSGMPWWGLLIIVAMVCGTAIAIVLILKKKNTQ